MRNITTFKMSGSEDLRSNIQRHIDSGDVIFVGDLTPDWLLGLITKKVKEDIENNKTQSIIFKSSDILQKIKFSKRQEINDIYYALYYTAPKHLNPNNLVIVTEHPKLEKDEKLEDRFRSIFNKIETAWGLQYNEYRVGVIYTPDDGMVWANY